MKNSKQNSKIKFGVILLLVLIIIASFVFCLFSYFKINSKDNSSYSISQNIEKNPAEKTILFCGLDKSEQLTDVIIYAHINYKTGKINALQIPRDSFVGEEYESGKINAVYKDSYKGNNGIKALTNYLSDNFKINTDNYVTITLDDLSKVIDDLGGIDIELEESLILDDGQKLEKGNNHLDGALAQTFVRHRRSYYNADLGRMNAQRTFLLGLMKKVESMTFFDAVDLLAQDYKYVKTDFSVSDIVHLYSLYKGLTAGDIQFFIPNGTGLNNNGYAVYELDKEDLTNILNEHFRPFSDKVEADEINTEKAMNIIEDSSASENNFETTDNGNSDSSNINESSNADTSSHFGESISENSDKITEKTGG